MECAGFNRKNDYDRDTPCDQDTLRKFARNTDSQALFSWFNKDVIRLIKKPGGFDEECIFLGDGLYLFVSDNEDLIDGLIFLMENYEKESPINIGASKDVSIKELAELWKQIIGYKGKFSWDNTKPNGMPRKLIDSGNINTLGWHAKTTLEQGLANTYTWYKEHIL